MASPAFLILSGRSLRRWGPLCRHYLDPPRVCLFLLFWGGRCLVVFVLGVLVTSDQATGRLGGLVSLRLFHRVGGFRAGREDRSGVSRLNLSCLLLLSCRAFLGTFRFDFLSLLRFLFCVVLCVCVCVFVLRGSFASERLETGPCGLHSEGDDDLPGCFGCRQL